MKVLRKEIEVEQESILSITKRINEAFLRIRDRDAMESDNICGNRRIGQQLIKDRTKDRDFIL